MRKLLVVLLAAACVVGFTVPTMAAVGENFALDGRVGFFTAWTSSDSDWTGGDSLTEMRWADASGRVRVRYNTDKVTGYFEIENGGLDLYWAQYNFGSFFLRFGLDDPISFNPVGSPPGPNGNLPVGQSLGGGAGPIVSLRFPFSKMMTLTVAGVAPSTTYATNVGATSTEIMMPALEVKVDFLTGGIPWAVWGAYQSVKAVSATLDENVTSYQVGGVVRPSFGPVRLNASIMMDQNQYMTGGPPWHSTPGFPTGYGWTYDVNDNLDLMAGAISAQWMINQRFSLVGGLGYQEWTNDADDKDANMGYYVNLPITVAPGFMILPYITIEDRGDIETGGGTFEQGTQTEFGAYWEITF
jgi:hypothetical protein